MGTIKGFQGMVYYKQEACKVHDDVNPLPYNGKHLTF